MSTLSNSRWVGVSAVVAATVGAITIAGLGAGAAPAEEPSVYVAVPPCRLVDTRPEFQVGDRSTPLQADETHAQQVTGAIGNCAVPEGARGVSLNVTAVGPTAPSFMTLFPEGDDVPVASNLNYLPGAAPTPNKVDVMLSSTGAIGVYNLAGTVDLVIDVSGYYSDTWIQEVMGRLDGTTTVTNFYTKSETYSKEEIDAALATKADVGDSYTKAEANARFAPGDTEVLVRQATSDVRGLLGSLLYAIEGVTIGVLDDGILELDQPGAVIDPIDGITEYELDAIDLCFDDLLLGALIDSITVSVRDELGAVTDLVDDVDLTAAGCRTIDLTSLPAGEAYFVELDAVGDVLTPILGSVQLTSIESTWAPVID